MVLQGLQPKSALNVGRGVGPQPGRLAAGYLDPHMVAERSLGAGRAPDSLHALHTRAIPWQAPQMRESELIEGAGGLDINQRDGATGIERNGGDLRLLFVAAQQCKHMANFLLD